MYAICCLLLTRRACLPFLPRYQDFYINLTKFPVTLTNLYVYFESREFGLSVRTRALCEQLITSRFLLSPRLDVCACVALKRSK